MFNVYDLDPALLSLDWRPSDLVGLGGTLLDLSVFLMLRRGLMDGRGYAYPLTTAIASALVLISLGERFNLAASISEIAWLGLAICCLLRTFYARRTLPAIGIGG